MPPGLVDVFQACPFEENLHIQDVLHLKWPREALEPRMGAGKSRMTVEVLGKKKKKPEITGGAA